MRLMTMVLSGAALAAIMVLALGRDMTTPGPDAAIDVITSDPIRAVLPASPTPADVVEASIDALEVAAEELRDPALQQHLRAIADDPAYLRSLALDAVASLGRGGAAALAFPVYRVETSRDHVRVYSTTIEMLPDSPSLSLSIAHEDGHARINDLVALACAPELVRESTARGLDGPAVARSVTEGLLRIGDAAHEAYHTSIRSDRMGGHDRKARAAAAVALEAGCR